jgi:hypothetical protein
LAIDHWQMEPLGHRLLDSIFMMRFPWNTCLLAFGLAGAACGGGSAPPPAQPVVANTPPPPPPADAAPVSEMAGVKAKMAGFADAMCACKDSACAQKVADAMTKWGQEEAKKDKEAPKLTEQDNKEFTALGERMGTCMQTAMGGGGKP